MNLKYFNDLNYGKINISPINFWEALGLSFLFDIVITLVNIPTDIFSETIFYFGLPVSRLVWYSFFIFLSCLYQYGTLLLIITIVSRRISFSEENNIRFKLYKRDYLICSLIMISYTLITYGWFDYILFSIPTTSFDDIMEYINSIPVIVLLIESCIIAPIFEELLYRGVLLNGLLNKYNYKRAIIYSAFVFGIAHLNLPQGINAFFLALILGLVFYYTKSIYICIIMHAVNNIVVNFIFYSTDEFWTKVSFIVVPIIGVIVMITCFKVLNFKGRKKEQLGKEDIY